MVVEGRNDDQSRNNRNSRILLNCALQDRMDGMEQDDSLWGRHLPPDP